MIVFGYLDPATGTLIVSAIVGGFAAAGLVIKNSWYRTKRLIGGSGSSVGVDATDTEDLRGDAIR